MEWLWWWAFFSCSILGWTFSWTGYQRRWLICFAKRESRIQKTLLPWWEPSNVTNELSPKLTIISRTYHLYIWSHFFIHTVLNTRSAMHCLRGFHYFTENNIIHVIIVMTHKVTYSCFVLREMCFQKNKFQIYWYLL